MKRNCILLHLCKKNEKCSFKWNVGCVSNLSICVFSFDYHSIVTQCKLRKNMRYDYKTTYKRHCPAHCALYYHEIMSIVVAKLILMEMNIKIRTEKYYTITGFTTNQYQVINSQAKSTPYRVWWRFERSRTIF